MRALPGKRGEGVEARLPGLESTEPVAGSGPAGFQAFSAGVRLSEP